jgi:glutamate--cysteine ligase
MRRIQLRELAAELGGIASEGLRRQDHRDDRGRTEAVYLEPTLELIAQGVTPADLTSKRWPGEWKRQMGRLVEASELVPELP